MDVTIDADNKTYKIFSELIPAIQAIFKLGFIPVQDEIIEFNEDMYEAYRKQTGYKYNENVQMFTVYPKNPKYLPKENVINMISASEMKMLKHGIAFFEDYAKKNKLSIFNSDVILNHAAKNFPRELTDGSKFERPKLRVLRHNEEVSTPKDQWMDFLSTVMDDKQVMNLRLKDEQGIIREDVIAPNAEKKPGGKKMDVEEFKAYTVKSLASRFGADEYSVALGISKKIDNETYEVIQVKQNKDGVTISSGIRIGQCYKDYLLGESLDEIISKIVKSIKETEEWTNKINISNVKEFDKIKDKIIFRPLNYNSNKKILEDHMYRLDGDIALVIYMLVKNDKDGIATAKVNKKTIGCWEMQENDVFDWAIENTAKLFKPYIVPFEKIITDGNIDDYPAINKYYVDPSFRLDKSQIGIYSLFTQNSINAAAAVFYKGAMKRLSEVLNNGFYLVVTSMSYVVLHVESLFSLEQVMGLAKRERNNPYASEEEFLTDGVYYYSREEENLKWMGSLRY